MQQYRPDIDGLRMLAVVPVVLYHADAPFVSGGYIGVDIFFVISGFLITRILYGEISAGQFSLVGFYERRARRILPSLFGVLIAAFIAGWFILLPREFAAFANSSIAAMLFVSNFWFYKVTSDYFALASEFAPLLHTWSLAVEEQFYIFFPLLLWLLARHSKKLTVTVLVLLVLLSFAGAVAALSWRPALSFYLAPMRGWELGIGGLLALGAAPQLNSKWIREAVALSAITAILFSIFAYDANTPFPGLAALPPCLGAAALILTGTHGGSVINRVLSFRPFVFVGLISYSLYLWHWPILSFLRIRLGAVDLPPAAAFFAVLLSFAAATLSWAFIEQPFRRRPPAGFRRSTIFQLSAVSMAFVIGLALVVAQSSGLPGRISPKVYEVYTTLEDQHPDIIRCEAATRPGELCNFGAEKDGDAHVDFLLWGDSHARALFAGVAAAAEQAGKTGLYSGLATCAPILGVYRRDLGPTPTCAHYNDQIFEQLKQRDDVGVVILAARWALAVEGARMPGENGTPAKLAWSMASQTGQERLQDNFEIFQKALPETIAQIRATGREVIILGQAPEIGWNVPKALVSNLRWDRPLPPPPSIESVMERQKRANAILTEAGQAPGVTTLMITPLICAPVCQVQIDGAPLYQDDDHLSRYGAEKFVAPLLLRAIWD